MRALLLTWRPVDVGRLCWIAPTRPNASLDRPRPHPEDTALQALEVDDEAAVDKRYFQASPGRHELTVRYQFAVDPTNIGPDAEPLWRDCQLSVKFNDFNAGQRYQLQAGNTGLRPWAKLYDEQRKVVGQAQPAGLSAHLIGAMLNA